MIAVRLEGRLGNQLFQYAFIYATSKKLNTGFYLDKSISSFLLPKYFNVKTDNLYLFDRYLFSIRGFKNIFNYHAKVAFYKFLKKIYGLEEHLIDNYRQPAEQLKTIFNKALYKGFFQSEDYFIDYKSDIIKLFTVKKKYRAQFEKIIQSLPPSKKYVTVHIRRSDYIGLDWAFDIRYYHKAIERIHRDENFYVFISDDIEFVRHEFEYLGNKYFSENNEIIDFQFLSNADICILSGSSYSWWGAYLNLKNPQVIAPQYWLGFKEEKEYPTGILPDNFTTLSVL